MLGFLGPIIKMAVGFGGNALKKFQDRKQKNDDARVAWETVAGKSMQDSWKDEYVTVVVTFPLWQIFVGNLLQAFTGNSAMLAANDASLIELGKLMETPYGQLMMVVVLAAVGIKTVKTLL